MSPPPKTKTYPHGRNLSLTSACLPVTSPYRPSAISGASTSTSTSPSNMSVSSFPSTSSALSAGGSSVVNDGDVAFAPVSPRLGTTTSEKRRSWRPFGWGDGANGVNGHGGVAEESSDEDYNPNGMGRSSFNSSPAMSGVTIVPGIGEPSPMGGAGTDSLRPNLKGRRRSSGEGWGAQVSNLVPTLVGIIFPSYYSSKQRYSPLKSSRLPSAHRPLFIRILILAYVLFSLFHFTSSILSPSSLPRRALTTENLERVKNFSWSSQGQGSGIADGEMDNSFGSIGGGFYDDDTVQELKEVGGEPVPAPQAQDQIDLAGVEKLDIVRQVQDGQDPKENPLGLFSQSGQDFSFSKLHGKVLGASRHPTIYSREREQEEFHGVQGERVLPFSQVAAYTIPDPNARPSLSTPGDVTALLYLTPGSLPYLTTFVSRWDGPVSLVFECANVDDEIAREIKRMRREDADGRVKKWVDWHVVVNPKFNSAAKKTKPKAKNWHLNLARFFARTDMVWFVGDGDNALPAGERAYLKKRLNDEMARRAVLGRGDMVVIPRFALTEKKALPTVGELDRLPLRKGNLVDAIKGGNTTMALWDKGWSLNEGPSNWDLWKKSKSDRGLAEDPRRGGGKGLGFPDDFDVFGSSSATTQNETSNDAEKERPIGGGKNLYLAHNYDYRFSPSILMSKEGHPWCTERFEHKWEACVYQNYLGGAEVWILPDAWSWVWNIDSTTSAMSGPEMRGDEETDLEVVDEAEAIKEAISDKLYKKYRQEACMHYGRELLLMDLWEHERARHLRAVCARVFSSWGVGLVSHLDV